MIKFITLEPPRLRQDEDGTIRLGKSRVTFDLIIREYERGVSPVEIVRRYDTLELADVHAALTYYFGQPEEAQAYLRRREEEAAQLRRQVEGAQPDTAGLLAELKARRQRLENERAAPGQ